jgi:hypothetical protein
VFGSGNRYHPQFDPDDFTPNVTNPWFPLKPGRTLVSTGVKHERTSDYYAQDRCGNVWYFGEDTAELDSRGRVVSREGSFHAGVKGAQPGVFM